MIIEPKPRMVCRLPGLAVTQEMYELVTDISLRFGLSYGEIIRRGLVLFLAEADKQIINPDNQIKQEANQ